MPPTLPVFSILQDLRSYSVKIFFILDNTTILGYFIFRIIVFALALVAEGSSLAHRLGSFVAAVAGYFVVAELVGLAEPASFSASAYHFVISAAHSDLPFVLVLGPGLECLVVLPSSAQPVVVLVLSLRPDSEQEVPS